MEQNVRAIFEKEKYQALSIKVVSLDFTRDVLCMSDESKDNEFEPDFGSNA